MGGEPLSRPPGGGRHEVEPHGTRRAHTGPTHGPTSGAGRRGQFAEWVAAGLISAERASASAPTGGASCRGRQPTATARRRTDREPWSSRALGYLGGVIMLTGAASSSASYWRDIPVAVRLL